jgi:arylsulfatase A-like enzyme
MLILNTGTLYKTVLGILLCAFLGFLGCARNDNRLSAGFKDYNIVLITVDTLRADYLGCYGAANKTSFIDSIAQNGFLFESMFTTSSTTFPAHVSLLTSLYPKDTRNGYSLADSVTTMAEVLGVHGYLSWAFVSALPLDVRFNLDQGFDYYDDDFSGCKGSLDLEGNKWFSHSYQVFDCNAEETTNRVLNTLKAKEHHTPYFLWVHYYDPHLPYTPPKSYYNPSKVTRDQFPYFLRSPSQSDLESLQELYGGEVTYVDYHLRKLMDGLKKLGKADNTILVIVADHGENLYQHDGYLDHSLVVYDTVMWIPCIIQLPGHRGKRIAELVSIIDVMPTLLDLIGIPYENIEGRSFIGLMEIKKAEPVREYVTCETNDFGVRSKDQTIALRTKNLKYIYNNWKQGKDMFFSLNGDPYENKPLKSLKEPAANELKDWFETWRKQYKSGDMASVQELDSETKEALKSLGYLQ